MASWQEFENAVPDFAGRVQARFAAGVNKTLATLRADGSPRISGTELSIADGRVTLGMMADSVKFADVLRDARVAVHSPSPDSPEGDPGQWPGDAKLAGRLTRIAVPDDSPAPDAGFFELDLTEAVLTWVDATGPRLVIESWHPTSGYRRRDRP